MEPSPDLPPKLWTLLRQGYDRTTLTADLMAGLTVAIAALPLSMAIAIAAGVRPERGIFTATVGEFLVSALGRSRFQIDGPAGAFIVLVANALARLGPAGLATAVALSGAGLGVLRLGRLIPHPVTLGFSAGIAVIIAASQIKDVAGLDLAHEPGAIGPKPLALWGARESVSDHGLGVGAATMGLILGLRAFAPRLPGLLIAVAEVSLAVWALDLPVETIASRFGALPRLSPWSWICAPCPGD